MDAALTQAVVYSLQLAMWMKCRGRDDGDLLALFKWHSTHIDMQRWILEDGTVEATCCSGSS